MIFSDVDIWEHIQDGSIVIDPFDRALLKRNSYLLRLSSLFRIINDNRIVDISDPDCFDQANYPQFNQQSILLEPDTLLLGCTVERISVPRNVVGFLSGISNIARLGVQVHTTSYVINAGYGHGEPSRVTFELSTVGARRVLLHHNVPICHLLFLETKTETSFLSPSARTGQSGPETSALYEQFGHFIREGKKIGT